MDIPAGGYVAYAFQYPCLIEPTFNGRQVARPVGLFTESGNPPVEHHAPYLLAGIRKPEVPKRNRHLDHVAGIGEPCVGIPNGLIRSVEIGLLGYLRPAPVHLNAQRRGPEPVRVTLIVEGIDQYGHKIVVDDVFTRREVGPDEFRLVVEGQKYRVQVAIVVGQVDRGVLARWHPVVGFALHEPFDASHRRGYFRRGRHAAEIVEFRGSIDVRDVQFVGLLGDGPWAPAQAQASEPKPRLDCVWPPAARQKGFPDDHDKGLSGLPTTMRPFYRHARTRGRDKIFIRSMKCRMGYSTVAKTDSGHYAFHLLCSWGAARRGAVLPRSVL